MVLFGPDSYNNIESIQDLQLTGEDPRTLAVDFIQQQLGRIHLDGGHPWHANDAEQRAFAYAGVAYAQDRTAEILLAENSTSTRGNTRASLDIVAFAGSLTELSKERLADARSVPEYAPFDEDAIVGFQAENQLPFWPAYPRGAGRTEDWQDPDCGTVSGVFIRGMIAAARNLETEAYWGLENLSGQQWAYLPPEYGSMKEVIDNVFFAPAGNGLSTADTYAESFDRLPPRQQADVYLQVHDGFTGMMQAYISVFVPQTLGEEFAPQRPDLP